MSSALAWKKTIILSFLPGKNKHEMYSSEETLSSLIFPSSFAVLLLPETRLSAKCMFYFSESFVIMR